VLTEDTASRCARVALENIERDYPRRLDHLLASPHDELKPRLVHPAFYGSYDWHSAVHMHWLLVRVARLYPVSRIAGEITDALDRHLASEPLAKELEYFRTPAGRIFERPYGWAWLLELQAEALRMQTRWSRALEPLACELAARMAQFIDEAPYPIRAGSHGNTAFACLLALDYARTAKDAALEFALRKAARRWYERDRDAPLAFEPSLDDFLSPSLVEALLLMEVMESGEFQRWLPRFAPEGFGALAEVPEIADHGDPKQSHLDGLCLTRAWCFARLGDQERAGKLIAAALPQVSGNYAGSHWLASFAVLALSAAALKTP
jgi:Protein of unknown function (DUF2891)